MPKFNGKAFYEYQLLVFEDFKIEVDKHFPKNSFEEIVLKKDICLNLNKQKANMKDAKYKKKLIATPCIINCLFTADLRTFLRTLAKRTGEAIFYL